MLCSTLKRYSESNNQHKAWWRWKHMTLMTTAWTTAFLFFPFEKQFDARWSLAFAHDHYWLGPCAVALYLIFVFVGPRFMASRKPFDLTRPLQYWNLFLAVFSFCGLARILPRLAQYIWKAGLTRSLCVSPIWAFAGGPPGFWAVCFVYSKYFELLDTVFIVLRKKHLSFLHWYHHATVLLFTWDAFIVEQPAGVHFCAVNYAVHAIMYFYYYLASTTRKPPTWGVIVTALQIAQMFFGTSITLIALYYGYTTPPSADPLESTSSSGCYVDQRNLIGSMGMYSTYCYLFALFFWKRYIAKTPKLCNTTTKPVK